jgi:hypothetical protein
MKKKTQTLCLVFSVILLLVFVTASARARSNPNPAPPQAFEAKGQIRWKKDMGLIPIGPGKILASTSACSPFLIIAYEYNASSSGVDKILAYSGRSTSQPREEGEYYVCDYSMQVPPDKSVIVRVGMGDVDPLPKMSRQSYYLTDPWIGGTNSRPPAGQERGFVGRRTESNKYLEFEIYEMVYHQSKTINSSSEGGPSPLLSRARSFAGAWQGKFGEGGFELIVQRAGTQVTGRLNINSVIYDIKGGADEATNTLRFMVARAGIPLPNGAMQVVGAGELVMDESGSSFTGYILGTAVTGTLIAR